MSDIGNKIRAARKAAGMTQTQLAKVINVPMTTLATWEQGKSEPKHNARVLLVKALDLSFDDLGFVDLVEYLEIEASPPHMISVVGYVGTGGIICPIEDDAMENSIKKIEVPPTVLPSTVAVIVRGDGMYPMFNNGMIIYYSKHKMNIADFMHEMVIVHLMDGRKAIKTLSQGSCHNRYTLLSHNASPISDVEIESVSPIDWIKPSL